MKCDQRLLVVQVESILDMVVVRWAIVVVANRKNELCEMTHDLGQIFNYLFEVLQVVLIKMLEIIILFILELE